jgi:hypothetical protein
MHKLLLSLLTTLTLITITPAYADGPNNCTGGLEHDELGEPVAVPEVDRYWQPANTPQRCGPQQPWRIGFVCPTNGADPRSVKCNGMPHGKLCYVPNNNFYEFFCPAPPGQWPSRMNANFDIFVCP